MTLDEIPLGTVEDNSFYDNNYLRLAPSFFFWSYNHRSLSWQGTFGFCLSNQFVLGSAVLAAGLGGSLGPWNFVKAVNDGWLWKARLWRWLRSKRQRLITEYRFEPAGIGEISDCWPDVCTLWQDKPNCALFIDFQVYGEKSGLNGTKIAVLWQPRFLLHLQAALQFPGWMMELEN